MEKLTPYVLVSGGACMRTQPLKWCGGNRLQLLLGFQSMVVDGQSMEVLLVPVAIPKRPVLLRCGGK